MAAWLRYNRAVCRNEECDAECRRFLEKEPGGIRPLRRSTHSSSPAPTPFSTLSGRSRRLKLQIQAPTHSTGRLALKNRPVPLRKSTAPEIRLSLIRWCKAGMKLRSCIIWVLGLLLAIASVDAVPDPPGVNRRTVSVTSRLCEAGGVCERRLHSDWSSPSHLRMRWIAFSSAYESNLPSDRIVGTGQAADPSPPALEARRNLYFHS